MTAAPVPPPDPGLRAVVDAHRTCEFVTLTKAGAPIAWPTSPLLREDGTFVITTSIALPQKAYNVRRDPRVALLFSNPTGSGLEGAPEVLVQGTAGCPDEIECGAEGLEEYWARLYERQPFSRRYSTNPLTRWLFDWYYFRLRITITPTAWTARAALRPGPPPDPAGAPAGVVGDALRAVAGYDSAVLATRDDTGAPVLRRVRVTGADGGALRLDVPDAGDLRPGPASLLCHSHDEQLWSLRSVVVVGEYRTSGDAGAFVPTRLVGQDVSGPLAMVRSVRELRRTARGYLERRGLPRPRVRWAQLDAAKAAAVRRDAAQPRSSSSRL